MARKPPPPILFTSGVTAKTGEPFVHLSWGEMHAQMNAEEVRQHALGLMMCADAAEFDAAFAKAMGGITPEVATMLVQIRNAREAAHGSWREQFQPTGEDDEAT